MICGRPPFFSEDLERMYELILYSALKFPPRIVISNETKDLITKLLDKNPATRLGSKDGFNELKNHAFFKQINLELVLQKRVNSPFKPSFIDKYDIQHFSREFTGQNPERVSIITSKNQELIKVNQDKFKDFK